MAAAERSLGSSRWKIFCMSISRRSRTSRLIPHRLNSATSICRSKPRMLKPARSASSMRVSRLFARKQNVGSFAISSSVIPWIAVTSAGIGTPGLNRRTRSITSPWGVTLMSASSTMRSFLTSRPVVSMSKKTSGRSSSKGRCIARPR